MLGTGGFARSWGDFSCPVWGAALWDWSLAASQAGELFGSSLARSSLNSLPPIGTEDQHSVNLP